MNHRLQRASPVDVVSTFLGAHDFPPDDAARQVPGQPRQGDDTAGRRAGLAEFCDVYCDDGYYTVEETRRILEAGAPRG